jgi:hemolysin activation/secretion protein/AraC-like DNA-binding protein
MAKLSQSARMAVPAHLAKFEKIIPNGAEWIMAAQDWVVLQLSEGVAYVFDSKAGRELPQGGVIVCPPNSRVALTASVLGRAVFRGMAMRVGSLTGFLTSLERHCLETEVARQCAPFLALAPDSEMARRLTQIFAQDQAPALANRLAFAQTFAELVAPQLREALNKGIENEKNQQEAKGRLRQLIGRIPESELSSLSLGELARQLHCCERHASRLFREECGTSFPSYVSDIRLRKACHLLLQGNRKIIDVALESGHGSLAHFNYVFKVRFHMTPTEWRERQTGPARRPPRSKLLQMAAAVVWLLLSVAGVSKCLGAEGPGSAGRDSVEPSVTNTVSTNATSTNATSTNATSTNAAAQAALKMKVDRYEVLGNTLLATNLISDILAPYTGDAVDLNGVTKAVGALQMEYFRRGWYTVKVTVPPQKNTNGVIVFEVIEGKLSAIKIQHNRYFSSNNIMAALPYLRTLQSGERILNTNIFQTELDRANSNPDRQILPEIRAGLEPGTSALFLDVKDRLPLHGRLEFDDYSPAGTPDLRVNANVSYANLWNLEHTLGLQYGFSPDGTKPSLGEDTHLSLNTLDAPEVAYYSGFYRAPFGAPAAVEDQIAQDPNHFGYNETTKQFVQPPAIGRPEFTVYASRSTTGPTLIGPEVILPGSTPRLQIGEQTNKQQYTSQTTVGGRLSFPLPTWQGIQSSWSIGMDYKEDKVVTLTTNYYSSIYGFSTNSTGSAVSTIQHTLPVNLGQTQPSLQYTPLFLGWNGSRQDHWGQGGSPDNRWSELDGGISLVAGTGGTLSRNIPFPTLISDNKEATTEFFAIRPQLSRTQVLPDNFTLYGNLAGQWANEPLLNLEQFALGGNASVRGYQEGEFYGDTGWLGQAELRSPYYWRGAGRSFGTQITAFSDYGKGYQLDPSAAQNPIQSFWGAGVGVHFRFGPHVESHVLVGFPLLNSTDSRSGHERIMFSLSAQL